MPEIDRFLGSILEQETGSIDNPWIRNKVRGSGSSAYGPYQTTHTLNSDYLKRSPDIFTDQEVKALSMLVEQQAVALKVGGRDRKRYAKQFSKEELDRFDYGGGFAIPDEVKPHIQSAQEKMVADTLRKSGGDPYEAAKRWHGGKNHRNRRPHVNYANDVVKRLSKDPRPPKTVRTASEEAEEEAWNRFSRHVGQ